MPPLKRMAPSGDKRHRAAVRVCSDFQGLLRALQAHSTCASPSAGGSELLPYLRTGLWVYVMDRLQEEVQALQCCPTINGQHQQSEATDRARWEVGFAGDWLG